VLSLPPNSFAFVMATGIVAGAVREAGWPRVSLPLLALAGLALVVLVVAWAWRLAAEAHGVLQLAGRPESAFGFLTVVAAVNVVSAGAGSAGVTAIALVLCWCGAALWIFLGYGIPLRLIVRRQGQSATRADGSWFLWVVATQSVAVAVGEITIRQPSEILGTTVVALWGIGVMLYLMLVTLVTLRLLTTAQSPDRLDASYWIYMGATAITALSGAIVLGIPGPLHVIGQAAPVVAGLTILLWAFGLWWVPLLVGLGVWRHGVRHVPLRYSTSLWSIVFPVGMFSAASMALGQVMDLVIITRIGQTGTYLAAAAWLASLIMMIVHARAEFRPVGGPRRF
jgi:tellurite resistance protein TehA-like permease